MVVKQNNYFTAIPTSETQQENADIPIAETVDAQSRTTRGEGSHDSCLNEDDTILPHASSTTRNDNMIMVEIIAPANLHEGYKFDAVFNGVPFPVIVPAGGCRKGQVLIVPFNPNASNGTPNAWKDGLLACTRYGIFHPSFLCAWCCPLILLGQVMTRLKMDWSGHVSRKPDEWKKTFRTLLLIGIFKYLIFEDPDHPLHAAFMILYMLYLTFLLIRVRKYIRNRDGISEDYGCGKYEDCCIAYFLPCCTVSQLARQTANYDIEIGYYMTQDGLAPSSSDEDVVDVDGQQDESMII